MTVVIIAFSDVTSDPRVRRQVETLSSAGIDVAVVGHANPGRELPGLLVAVPQTAPGWRRRIATAVRQFPAWLGHRAAMAGYWSNPVHRAALRETTALRPTLIHANDWVTLPVAVFAAKQFNCPVLYDSHEFATGEYEERMSWRWFFQRFIKAVEERHIHKANRVLTVSAGIAQELQSLYALPRPPAVVRNMPHYLELPLRKPTDRIQVLYHGRLHASRGLEALLDSVPLWQADRHFVIRGPGPKDYLAALQRRVQKLRVTDRVSFAQSVAAESLIPLANQADIGVVPARYDSIQNRFSLPNKLFEYVMAGLAIVSSPADEIAGLVRRFALGEVSSDLAPESVAASVNRLTPERILAAKEASLKAARTLNWDHEKQRLLMIYEELGVR